jgi:hypothetical protein
LANLKSHLRCDRSLESCVHSGSCDATPFSRYAQSQISVSGWIDIRSARCGLSSPQDEGIAPHNQDIRDLARERDSNVESQLERHKSVGGAIVSALGDWEWATHEVMVTLARIQGFEILGADFTGNVPSRSSQLMAVVFHP